MRISIAIVMVMLLSACNAGSGRYPADRGDASTSTTSSQQVLPLAADEDRGPGGTETGDRGPGAAAGSSGIGSTIPDTSGNAPAATTTTTTTTLAGVTVDSQEVESALAEFDELLGSLVSAISSMDQAFEQGE